VGALQTPGLLARRPWLGWLLVLLGVIIFGVMAWSLQTQQPLIQTDLQITNDLHQTALHSSPFLIALMFGGYYLGEHVIFALGVVFGLYFISKRRWPELSMVVVGWGSELGLLFLSSPYFHRPRPRFDVMLWSQTPGSSFPSGHSISAVVCYGLLAYLLVPRLSSHVWKAVVIVGAVLIILFIGYSRVFLGDHYPTDIVAGYGIGLAWGGLVYTTVELIAARRGKQAPGVPTAIGDDI